MTPKEKAEQLVSRYKTEILRCNDHIDGFVIEELAEECALIAVDQVITQCNVMDGGFSFENEIYYWQKVKQEIEAL